MMRLRSIPAGGLRQQIQSLTKIVEQGKVVPKHMLAHATTQQIYGEFDTTLMA